MPFLTGAPDMTYAYGGLYDIKAETIWVGTVWGKSYRIVVPAGFRTDLASIPRIFWAFLPPNGWWEKAAVVHDRLCVELAEGTCGITSREVDGLFRRIAYEEVARRRWLAWLVSWLLWDGVRIGALVNPTRRAGWWRDAPGVLAITGTLLVAAFYALSALHWLAHTVA